MNSKAGYVYILTNKNNRVLYAGSSSGVVQRVSFHKKAYLNGFTRKYKANKLVYYEVLPDRKSTQKRERTIKGWKRKKKIQLIESVNPKWKDLYCRLERDPSSLPACR